MRACRLRVGKTHRRSEGYAYTEIRGLTARGVEQAHVLAVLEQAGKPKTATIGCTGVSKRCWIGPLREVVPLRCAALVPVWRKANRWQPSEAEMDSCSRCGESGQGVLEG